MRRRDWLFLDPWLTAALAVALSLPIARIGSPITFFPDSAGFQQCNWSAWECNNGPLYPAMMQLLPMPLVGFLQQLILGLGFAALAFVASRGLTVRRRLAVFVFLGVALQTPGISYWSGTALTESTSLALSLLALATCIYFFQRRGTVIWPLLASLGLLGISSLVSSRVALTGAVFLLVAVTAAALLKMIPPKSVLVTIVGVFAVALVTAPTVLTQTERLRADYALGRDFIYGSYSPAVRAYFDAIGPPCSITPTSGATARSQCPERIAWWAQGHPSTTELLASGALTASVTKKDGLVLAFIPPVFSGSGELVSYGGIDGAVPAPANKSLVTKLAEASLFPMWVVLAAAVFTVVIWRRSKGNRARTILLSPFLLMLLGFLALIPLEFVIWSTDGQELPRHLTPWTQIVLLVAPVVALQLNRRTRGTFEKR